MKKLLLLIFVVILTMPLSAQNKASAVSVRRQARTLSLKQLPNCYVYKQVRTFQTLRKPEKARNRSLGMLQATYSEIFPPTLFLCREKLPILIQGAPLQVSSPKPTLRLRKIPHSLQAESPQKSETLILKR